MEQGLNLSGQGRPGREHPAHDEARPQAEQAPEE